MFSFSLFTMSRCSNGFVDGIINGMVLGFIFGAALCFARNGRGVYPLVNGGMRYAMPGSLIFGTLGAIRHCL